ncbi:beta-galactosidase trimerization domain-containing protein [bacterium]|nr:beta-galactosidase trimerization domain-containing protein [bacterium]
MKQTLMVVGILTLLVPMARAADVAGEARVKAAQAYRAKGEPVVPAPDGTIFCEAEEFKLVKPAGNKTPGWRAGYWGQNYYAATFANTFLSRKAFLGAPEECPETVATIEVDVKEAGNYLALVRYEAAYRFETQFRVKIEQAGKVKLDRLYGARKNLKIWAFGNKLKAEVAWPWGAVENVVWEGHDAHVALQPGRAKLSLIAGPQPGPPAKRNVDLVMLTKDEEQVKMRIEKEGYLPLDGWLTQAGDVWMRVKNTGNAKVTIKSSGAPGGPFQQHSPYWVHIRKWEPVLVELEPGASSDWIEVGSTMDTLNDGQWGFASSGPCQVEFGARTAAGQIESIRVFDANGPLPLVGYADVRYCRQVQTRDEANRELFNYLKKLPVRGKQLERTMVVAAGAMPKEFYAFYGVNGAHLKGPKGYTDWRGKTAAQLAEMCGKLSDAERQNLLVMSLGDEIGLPAPNAQAASAGFVAFLKGHGVAPNDLDPAAGGDWSKIAYSADETIKDAKPGLYYWSHRYLYHYGIHEQKKLTDVLRGCLPNAHIGANFSPHHGGGEYTFLGEVFKWVTCFRDQGMTLPWAEDYIWQVPVGTPQMNGINLDLFRAGLRGQPEAKLLYYVMPHMPGNTPAMWRRLWHNAIGHGATILNLFEFDPVWVAYTENHVTGREMYAMVLQTLRELGLYEDIVQTGAVRPGRVGLWFSETADIWRDNTPSFGAAKRGLYVAILGQQVPLDFLVEQDAADGTLNDYDVLYLTDNHVSRAAAAKIAAWVKRGGKLFATAGAGMFDEYQQPNKVLRELLGVEQTGLVMTADQQVHFIKQDLRFVKPVGEVTLAEPAAKFPVFGVVSQIKPAGGAKVRGTFANGAPAVVVHQVGKGETLYCAFLPSLSYFYPATPLKPLDRGSTDDAMSHFIPVDFDQAVAGLVGEAVAGVERPVRSSVPLVEASVIEAKAGTAILVSNWSGQPAKGLTLTVSFKVPTRKVELASGGKIKVQKEGGKVRLTFDLEEADAVILR